MIKSLELDGKTYKIVKGKFYDEHFLTPPKTELIDIYGEISKRKDDFSDEELYQFVLDAKGEECYHAAFEIISELEKKAVLTNDYAVICKIAPVKTSLFRSLQRSADAIEYFDKLTANYGSRVVSGALYTSIAAAFCDTREYGRAKIYANKAFATSGGSMELSAVYGRIKKESN